MLVHTLRSKAGLPWCLCAVQCIHGYVYVPAGNLPRRESVWRKGRSSWSYAGNSRLRESWLATWSGSARQVSLKTHATHPTYSHPFLTLRMCYQKAPDFSLWRLLSLCDFLWKLFISHLCSAAVGADVSMPVCCSALPLASSSTATEWPSTLSTSWFIPSLFPWLPVTALFISICPCTLNVMELSVAGGVQWSGASLVSHGCSGSLHSV